MRKELDFTYLLSELNFDNPIKLILRGFKHLSSILWSCMCIPSFSLKRRFILLSNKLSKWHSRPQNYCTSIMVSIFLSSNSQRLGLFEEILYQHEKQGAAIWHIPIRYREFYYVKMVIRFSNPLNWEKKLHFWAFFCQI